MNITSNSKVTITNTCSMCQGEKRVVVANPYAGVEPADVECLACQGVGETTETITLNDLFEYMNRALTRRLWLRNVEHAERERYL